MEYQVIDNFLDKDYFNILRRLFMEEDNGTDTRTPWFYQSTISYPKGYDKPIEEDNLFYMIHLLYNNNVPMSNFYNKMAPLLQKLKVTCLIRIKTNLYPNTTILHEHLMHTDGDFSQFAALLSLNTCDGYTKLKDGTKIDSVANRVLLFDPCEEHCSTTTTNVKARFNINVNYIREQKL
jgi:hypothetical protein